MKTFLNLRINLGFSIKFYPLILLLSLLLSCKKFIEIDAPITSINDKNVYATNSNATAVLTGIYTKMSNNPFSLNLSLYPDLLADNMTLFDQNNISAQQYYQNDLNSLYKNQLTNYWFDLYSYIYVVNAAIEGISASQGLSPAVKQRLLGEAYFLRAFYNFYLVNIYGNVPLLTSIDYSINSIKGNNQVSKTYEQIILDLQQAQSLLDDDYKDGSVINNSTDRVRPNRMAATALLARVYLYTNKFVQAEVESSKIISKSDVYSLSDLNSVFLKNSSETIWSLQPVSTNVNTMEGNFYIYSSDGPNGINFVFLSDDILNSFEPGDLRKKYWIGTFDANNTIYSYPLKYKVKVGDPSESKEFTVVLRLAEQYLIRAEARIQQEHISGGIADLNALRTRSRAEATIQIPNPLPNLSVNLNKEQALSAVQKERRVELFTEWGDRWFDLKRTGNINEIMSRITPLKGGTWSSYKSLLPIPQSEIKLNSNLIQNPGYN